MIRSTTKYSTLFTVLLALVMSIADSSWGAITSTGSVDPTDPTTATSADDVYAGYLAAGTITVAGSSTLLADEIVVGDGGAGQLSIQGAGASAVAGYFYAGYNTEGTIAVSNGGSITVDEAYVGYDGNGSLDFTNGSTGSLGETYIGYDSPGLLSISGGSVVNSAHTYVGYDGDGTIEISGVDSLLNVSGEFYSGYDGDEDAFWNISNGGSLNATNASEAFVLAYEADSTYNFGIGDDGMGAISAGAIAAAGDVTRGSTGEMYYSMTLDPGTILNVGDRFTLIDYGTWNAGTFLVADGLGGFVNLADGDTYVLGGNSFLIDYDTDLGGGDLAFTATVIPEPSAALLMAWSGVLGMFGRRRQMAM